MAALPYVLAGEVPLSWQPHNGAHSMQYRSMQCTFRALAAAQQPLADLFLGEQLQSLSTAMQKTARAHTRTFLMQHTATARRTCPSLRHAMCVRSGESVGEAVARLQGYLSQFQRAPWTLQRLCELLLEPQNQYSRLHKLVRRRCHGAGACKRAHGSWEFMAGG